MNRRTMIVLLAALELASVGLGYYFGGWIGVLIVAASSALAFGLRHLVLRYRGRFFGGWSFMTGWVSGFWAARMLLLKRWHRRRKLLKLLRLPMAPRQRFIRRMRMMLASRGRPGHDPIVTYPEVYFISILGVALIYLLVGFVLKGTMIDLHGSVYSLGTLIWWAGFAYYAASIRIVDRSRVAGVLIFGIPTVEISGFIVIDLVWLFKFVSYPLAPIEINAPTSPQKVWRGRAPDGKPSPIPKNSDWEEPIRVVFAGREHGDLPKVLKKIIKKDDPLLKRATEEVSFVVRLSIRRGTKYNDWGFFDFYVRIGTLDAAMSQVKSVGIAKVNEDFTKVSVAEALANLKKHNEQLEQHLDAIVKNWGVDVVTAKITIGLSYSMNKSIEGIPQAQATAQERVLLGEADRKVIALKGKGTGEAEQAELTGRGKGLKEMMERAGIDDPRVAIAADTAREIARGPNSKLFFPVDIAKLTDSLARAFPESKSAK